MRTRLFVAGSVLALFAGALEVDARPKLRLVVNGTFAPSQTEFSAHRTFREFIEEGQIDSQHTADGGAGFEVGLRYDFAKHVGVLASIGLASRDGSATVVAQIPHPLYFNQPREASREVTGLAYKETAQSLDLVLHTTTGAWDLAVMGGVAFFQVKADLIDGVQYSQAYPFDTATLTGTSQVSAKESPIGFGVGAMVDRRLGRHVALGAQARFNRATVELAPATGSHAELTTGGLQLAAGLRILF